MSQNTKHTICVGEVKVCVIPEMKEKPDFQTCQSVIRCIQLMIQGFHSHTFLLHINPSCCVLFYQIIFRRKKCQVMHTFVIIFSLSFPSPKSQVSAGKLNMYVC